MSEITWTFAALEARLAEMHDIASSRRTAFAARLKNFHRLGFPSDLERSKGKTSLYRVGQIVEMAIALELTQLGLTPERIVRVLTLGALPVFSATRMAASWLISASKAAEKGDNGETIASPMFLYLDPASLSDLTFDWDVSETPDSDRAVSTFFYGGGPIVAEMFGNWRAGHNRRSAIINVTRMLDALAGPMFVNGKGLRTAEREAFWLQTMQWADEVEDTYADDDFADLLFDHFTSERVALGHLSERGNGVPIDWIEVRRELEKLAAELNFPVRIVDVVESWLRVPESRPIGGSANVR